MNVPRHVADLARSTKVKRLAYLVPVQGLLALTLAAVLAGQGRPAEPSLQGDGSLKVMTYNMYVGSEYAGVTNADYGSFLQAITGLIMDARASDPPARASAIARQIAAARPHIVSLQEVATWSTGPTPTALQVEFDFLQLLLDAVAAEGTPYTPVVALTSFDITLPSSLGLYVRNTWRVVMLARADLKLDDLSFVNVQAATWTPPATWVVPLRALGADCATPRVPGTPACLLPFPRGWVSADVFYRGKQLRVVGAHLDSRDPTKNLAQGLELLNGPAATSLPVVIAGDLNCDLADAGDPAYQTCTGLIDAGFVDAWSSKRPFESGFTKELPDLTRRSDYVMSRGPFGVQAAAIVGGAVEDRTVSGLWPSNHCGVVARLQLPDKDE